LVKRLAGQDLEPLLLGAGDHLLVLAPLLA